MSNPNLSGSPAAFLESLYYVVGYTTYVTYCSIRFYYTTALVST